MTLLFTVILVALVFEYINGYHDTANSIATVVSTKVLTPRQAVLLAAVTNLLGAMWGTAVAKTISSGLVDSKLVSMTSDIIICALLGAIIWNVITWSQPNPHHWYQGGGLLWKVIVPMVTSPLAGFILGFIVMALLYITLRN